MPEVSVSGDVVVVTGAGRGLGAAYALLLAKRGASVIVHDAGLSPEGSDPDSSIAASLAEQIIAAGGSAVAHSADLADPAASDSLLSSTVERFGRVDALIHSAGLVLRKPIDEISDQELLRLQAVNSEAAFRLCRAVWPSMKEQRYGRIVLTTSGHAFAFDPEGSADGLSAYCLGKGAQLGLAMALAAEGGAYGIRVNALSPAAKTRMMSRNVPPGTWLVEHVAGVAVWLASRECNLTGALVRAGGGSLALGAIRNVQEFELGDTAGEVDAVARALGSINPTPD
jgi:NAD(P)-dependent dehydrogenase (short-subunit alcohol dehydrogenase family)